MKKSIYFLILCLLSVVVVKADSPKDFHVLLDDLGKKNQVVKSINSTNENAYNIKYIGQEDSEEKQIETLTRKATYLLLGDEKTEFSVDSYYERKQAFYDMIYSVDVPKKEDGSYDLNSQEAIDNGVASFSATLFKNVALTSPTYEKIGQPIVIKADNGYYATIAVKGVEYDSYDDENPRKNIREKKDLVFYFLFRKANNEYKIYWQQVHYAKDIDKYFTDSFDQDASTSYHIENNYEDVSSMFDFSKLKKVSEQQKKNLYEKNKENSVILNAYYNNTLKHTGNGFYLNNGIIVSTWSFVKESLQDTQYISILDSKKKTHILDGIVYVNEDLDLVVLKQKEESKTSVKLGEAKNMKQEDPIFTISSSAGVNLKLTSGIYVSQSSDILKNVLSLTEEQKGSPLYNLKGEVVGMNTNKLVNNSFSNAISSNLLKEIQTKLKNTKFSSIKTLSFQELKEKYFYNEPSKEEVVKNIKKSIWNKMKKIGKIEEKIPMELVKANYKNKTMSLRYKNVISSFTSNISLSKNYRDELVLEGYKETYKSENKYVYENKKYQVILTSEFDYLIVIIVEK